MRRTVKKTNKGTGKRTGVSSPAARKVGTSIELPDGMWERISHKAYELWEERGRQEGNALRDWLDAEEIVMEEIHEARE